LTHIPIFIFLFFFIPISVLLKFIGLNILSVFTCLFFYRIAFHYYLFHLKKIKKVLIIGANDRAKAVTEVIKNKKALQMEVVGIVKAAEINKKLSDELLKAMHFDLIQNNREEINKQIEDEQNFDYSEAQIISEIKNFANILKENKIDIVIFTHKSNLIPVIPKNIKIYLMTDFYEMVTGKYYIDDDSIEDFVYTVHKKYENSLYDLFKRRFDITMALIILGATLPIIGFIAYKVWLTDKHSPFFTQTRVGKNGQKFECYKLRTMYVNDYIPKNGEDVKCSEESKTDNRIIPFCKFIRKIRFDEIPQMINILKGEMSIVGPRAEWVELANIYKTQILGYENRVVVPTAWTGWAQVNQGHCISTDSVREKLQYDLYYIKYRNILWDVAILVKAVFMACSGRHK